MMFLRESGAARTRTGRFPQRQPWAGRVDTLSRRSTSRFRRGYHSVRADRVGRGGARRFNTGPIWVNVF